MNINCLFTTCQWSGSENEAFDHFETYHKKFLRDPKGNLYFDFTFEDLQQDAFVLCSPNGLYWFRKNQQHPSRTDGFAFGVFHIGESEEVEYTLKLGLKREGHCEYWGPYGSAQDQINQQADEDEFILKFDINFLELINESMPSQCLRLYFGDFDDNEDKLHPGPHDIEWTEENEDLNRFCVQQFTCPVCFEFIRHDARFCENKHFICLNCFEKMHRRKKLKCPTCRGTFWDDCVNEDVNRFLGMIKWPDMPAIKVNNEMEEFLKSIPGVELVKVKGGENV